MDSQKYISDIAFTETVKAWQTENGSRESYQRMIEEEDWSDRITPHLEVRLNEVNSFYLATVNTAGQPYIQHRGGPKGFLRIIDDKTLGIADFKGNQQFISTGNLSESNKVHLFIMDYTQRSRIKIWAEARLVEDDISLIESLTVPGYRGEPERAILFDVKAWTVNCPAHIPQKVDLIHVRNVIASLEARVKELEDENAELRSFVGKTAPAE